MPYEKNEVAPSNQVRADAMGLSQTSRVGATVGAQGQELARRPWAVAFTGNNEPTRDTFCVANDDTCKGRRAKGTEYCAGHLRSQGVIK